MYRIVIVINVFLDDQPPVCALRTQLIVTRSGHMHLCAATLWVIYRHPHQLVSLHFIFSLSESPVRKEITTKGVEGPQISEPGQGTA